VEIGIRLTRQLHLEDLVAAMTSKSPQDRPPSAAHALERLERPKVASEQPTELLDPSFNRRTERLPQTTHPPPPTPRYVHPRDRADRRKVAAVILGLLAASTIVVLVALSGGGDSAGGGGQQAKGGQGERASLSAGAGESSRPTDSGEAAGAPESEVSKGTESAPPSDSSEPDPARGSALNEQGFSLIQAGEYEAAVPILEEAVSSFPEGTEDLDYAYALFNLGNALRLSGRPEEAIPILEQRLQFSNQEAEVRKELEAAYAEAGEPTSFKDD